jgi:hypothetical protein
MVLSMEKQIQLRERSLMLARDRAEYAVALELARAMLAAAEHLKSIASGLAAEFGLVKWREAGGSIDESLVDVLLNGLECDLPIEWRQAVVDAVPEVPVGFDDDELRAESERVRDRVQGVVRNLAGLGESQD